MAKPACSSYDFIYYKLKRSWLSLTVSGLVDTFLLAGTGEYYEKSLSLSQTVGDRRSEAIALYNLSLVYLEQLCLDVTEEYTTRYLMISRSIGNRLAEAYAPNILGSIRLQQGLYSEAEAMYQQGLKIAQENDWGVVVQLSRVTLGDLQLYRWLRERQPAWLEAAIQQYDQVLAIPHSNLGGECYAHLALAHHFASRREPALEALQLGLQHVDASAVMDHKWLELAAAAIDGQSLDTLRQWFDQHACYRACAFIDCLSDVQKP